MEYLEYSKTKGIYVGLVCLWTSVHNFRSLPSDRPKTRKGRIGGAASHLG